MKLDRAQLLGLGRTPPNKRLAKALGQPSLAGTGRALEDEVLLALQPRDHLRQYATRQETTLGDDVGDAVGFNRGRVGLPVGLFLFLDDGQWLGVFSELLRPVGIHEETRDVLVLPLEGEGHQLPRHVVILEARPGHGRAVSV